MATHLVHRVLSQVFGSFVLPRDLAIFVSPSRQEVQIQKKPIAKYATCHRAYRGDARGLFESVVSDNMVDVSP